MSRVRPEVMRKLALVAAGLLVSTGAFGLPWDVDMADSQSVKGYEQPMRPLPEGVVAQDSVLTPLGFTPNFTRGTPEGEALKAPFAASEDVLETGERMFGIYCTPCHGDGVELGPVAAPGRFPGVLKLGGPSGILKARSDGYLYLTVRNGGAIMPYYGWAMSDEEMWSLVHYLRTLPEGAYVPPAPPAAEESEG